MTMDLDQETSPLDSRLWSSFSVSLVIFLAMHYRCWCDYLEGRWGGGRRQRGNHP